MGIPYALQEGRPLRAARSGRERGQWAGTPANGGLSVQAGRDLQPVRAARVARRADPMRSTLRCQVEVKVNLAACLWPVVWLLSLLV